MKSLLTKNVPYTPSSAIESEIDIDVKPMMNVLLILIPFLVSLAVYTRLSIIELSLPPNITSISAGASEGKPKLRLTIVVAPQYCALTYGETMLDSFPRIEKQYPLDMLKESLLRNRSRADITDEVVVAPHDGIIFDNVVNIMDLCTVAGFSKVSLASASN